MLGLRWLKRIAYMNRNAQRYIGYALGEILLVIAGILIALQIDNWNSERKDQATLNNYLRTIAGNLRDDIRLLEQLSAARSESALLAGNAQTELLNQSSFSVDEILYLAQAMRAAETIAHFNANTSGFDALKNSGVLDELQGQDAETILSRYYVGTVRVGKLEQAHNARIISALSLPVDASFIEYFALNDPTIFTPARFEELQSFYSDYYHGQYARRLLGTASDSGSILREYETLVSLAHLFIDMTETDSHNLDDQARESLANIDSLEQGGGNPDVVRHGRFNIGYFNLNFGYPFSIDGVEISRYQYINHDFASHEDDAFRLTYNGGADWAVIFLTARDRPNSTGRPSLNFERFDKILLEAKGANGGERLLLHLKDKHDPDDGSQTNVEIVLSDQWEMYEFDLTRFENANPSELHVVLGFLIEDQNEPLSFALRTVRFVGPDK